MSLVPHTHTSTSHRAKSRIASATLSTAVSEATKRMMKLMKTTGMTVGSRDC